MGAVVLDSSVVIGLLDAADALHEQALTALIRRTADGAEFSLPASVLAEVLVGEARRSRPAVDLRRRHLTELFGQVRVLDEEVAAAAANLRAGHRSLRLPDALVIATGIVDDADTILTADKRWAGVDKRVEVLS